MAEDANHITPILHLEMIDKVNADSCYLPVSMTTTKDNLYIHRSCRGEFIDVFDRSNLREVKDVIQADKYKLHPMDIVACNLSNCVYILSIKGKGSKINSVDKITKVDEQQFTVSPWICDFGPQEEYVMCVSAKGCLIISRTEKPDEVIRIYNMDGSLQQQIKLSLDLFYVSRIIPKPNGNLVFVSLNYEFRKRLTETDLDGNIVKQYQSSLLAVDAEYADSSGRLLMVDQGNRFQLLDSELNPLDVTVPQSMSDKLWAFPRFVHYDSLRNEVLLVDFKLGAGTGLFLSAFAFREGT